MTFRYLSSLCLLWSTAAILLGCGGGADAKNTATGNAAGNSATSPVLAGVYYDSSSGHGFWGVITPSNRWYGLNYATYNPNIYSGDLTGAGTLQASITAPGMKYQNTVDAVLSGSANLTSSGSGKLAGSLGLSTPSISTFNINATSPTGYTFASAAQLSAVAGQWTGQLSFGSGSSANFGITIASSDGALTARASDGTEKFADCKWTASSSNLTANTQINLYALTLHMEHVTNCDSDLDGKTLTGIAFITPGISNTQRLIWVAITPEGHAIAYKAERTAP